MSDIRTDRNRDPTWDHQQPPLRANDHRNTFATASLVCGIGSILGYFVPGVGLVLGLLAVIFGVLGLIRPGGIVRSLTGLVLGLLPALLYLGLFCLLVVAMCATILTGGYSDDGDWADPAPPAASSGGSDPDAPPTWPVDVDTACFHFVAPGAYLPASTRHDRKRCAVRLQLRGTTTRGGVFVPSRHGAVVGTITVRPIAAAVEEKLAPNGTLDTMVTALGRSYIPHIGEVESLRGHTLLGSSNANITTLHPASDDIKHEVVISAYSAYRYYEGGTETHFFVVTVSTPLDNLDEITGMLSESWDWK